VLGSHALHVLQGNELDYSAAGRVAIEISFRKNSAE
jgi:hypothetical protein